MSEHTYEEHGINVQLLYHYASSVGTLKYVNGFALCNSELLGNQQERNSEVLKGIKSP